MPQVGSDTAAAGTGGLPLSLPAAVLGGAASLALRLSASVCGTAPSDGESCIFTRLAEARVGFFGFALAAACAVAPLAASFLRLGGSTLDRAGCAERSPSFGRTVGGECSVETAGDHKAEGLSSRQRPPECLTTMRLCGCSGVLFAAIGALGGFCHEKLCRRRAEEAASAV